MVIKSLTRSDNVAVGLLKVNTSGLSVEAKYFLVRVVLEFAEQPVSLSVSELSERFGMGRAAVKRARDELLTSDSGLGSGYLQKHFAPARSRTGLEATPRGRPRRGVILSEPLLHQIEDAEGDAGIRGAILRTALFGGRKRVNCLATRDTPESHGGLKERESRLTVAGRLLLAALWALAGEGGVVKDASHSRLSKLTGMTQLRVRDQLRRLQRLDYILIMVPGLTGRLVPGRAPGMVVLNYLHPEFAAVCRADRYRMVRTLCDPLLPIIRAYEDADKIETSYPHGVAHGEGRNLSTTNDVSLGWNRVFSGEPHKERAQRYLTVKACEYVSNLLNGDVRHLMSSVYNINANVHSCMSRELFANSGLARINRHLPDNLTNWLYRGVRAAARKAIEDVAASQGVTIKEMMHRIESRCRHFQVIPDFQQIGFVMVTYEECI
ncbi:MULTISPECIES: hypothetical protein [Gammaproteobacteria]|jgi:hypothetical protein|uniref:hypothetical protein n=2 Tax=Pseudomonadota TaxID=1224 RepID=UPI001A13EDA1|nr:hypothetical protein [Alcanivorax sp.]